MSLRTLASEDSAMILDMDGDEIVITSPDDEESYTLNGQFIRRGVDIDPGTGLSVQGDVSAFTVSLLSLVSAGLSDPERLKNEKGWIVIGSDVLGGEVKMRVNTAMLDRTIGRVTIIGKL